MQTLKHTDLSFVEEYEKRLLELEDLEAKLEFLDASRDVDLFSLALSIPVEFSPAILGTIGALKYIEDGNMGSFAVAVGGYLVQSFLSKYVKKGMVTYQIADDFRHRRELRKRIARTDRSLFEIEKRMYRADLLYSESLDG